MPEESATYLHILKNEEQETKKCISKELYILIKFIKYLIVFPLTILLSTKIKMLFSNKNLSFSFNYFFFHSL